MSHRTNKPEGRSLSLPSVVFALAFILLGWIASPSAQLLVVGVFVQLVVGLLCLSLVRATFRVAEKIIESTTRRACRRPDRLTTHPVLESAVFARLLCPMADRKAGRAPPVPVVL